MSGLAALLAGHNRPGTYLWESSLEPGDVAHTVEHAGWSFVHVDTWAVEEKPAFLEAMARGLGLPDESAASFDALSDGLGDVDAADSAGVVLLWDGWGPFARADERAFSVALSVLGGRVHADRGDRFAVLLRGDGPPVDVSQLEANPG